VELKFGVSTEWDFAKMYRFDKLFETISVTEMTETFPVAYRIAGSPVNRMKLVNRGMTVRDVVALIARTRGEAVDQVSLDDALLELDDCFDGYYSSSSTIFVFSKSEPPAVGRRATVGEGKDVPLPVKVGATTSDLVSDVKSKGQRVSVGGRELHGGTIEGLPVRDVPVVDNRSENLPVPKRTMTIFVKTLTGKRLKLRVAPTARIEDIKARIQRKEGIPPEQMRLIFEGRQLDDEQTLQDYGVRDQSVVSLILNLRG
jgi:ubiquitin